MSQDSNPRGPLQNMVVDVLLVTAAVSVVLTQPLGKLRTPSATPAPIARHSPLIQLSLNEATADELGLLPQIGPKMADRIIRFRGSQPAIRSWAEFEDISGMGPATIQTIRPWCTIDSVADDLASNH